MSWLIGGHFILRAVTHYCLIYFDAQIVPHLASGVSPPPILSVCFQNALIISALPCLLAPEVVLASGDFLCAALESIGVQGALALVSDGV